MFGYVKHTPDNVIKVFKEVGLPYEYWEEAAASVRAGYEYANSFKPLFHNITAPLVVPIALLGTDWHSENLPPLFEGYDNDTNLNGDRFQYVDGVKQPVSYDPEDEFAIANNFWRPGHHPREYWSRYVWIGLRNRGKRAYMLPTSGTIDQPERIWGEQGLTRGGDGKSPKTGWMVTEWAGHWQIIGVQPMTGIMKGRFHEPRWGWKTGLSRALNKGLVMAAGIGPKMRKSKGE